jgi:hypothetical protein
VNIAKQLERENIVEYILFMWQMEDLIRACLFDLDTIYQTIIQKFETSEETKWEIKEWFHRRIDQMMKEGIAEKGHLSDIRQYQLQLQHLHQALIALLQDPVYIKLYEKAQPYILELYKKSDGKIVHETEICLTALYGIMILKLQKKEISKDTLNAIQDISKMMGYLAKKFNEYRRGELRLPNFKKN